MANWKKILLGGCLVTFGGSLLACCGGGLALTLFGPGILASAFVEDQPLPVAFPTPDPARAQAIAQRVQVELAQKRTTFVTAEELNQLAIADQTDGSVQMRIASDRPGHVVMDLSARMDPDRKYINVRVGGELVMERGWCTHATFDELRFASWDLGRYVAGQELAQNLNQSFANERAKDPSLAEKLDKIDRLATERDGFSLTVNESY